MNFQLQQEYFCPNCGDIIRSFGDGCDMCCKPIPVDPVKHSTVLSFNVPNTGVRYYFTACDDLPVASRNEISKLVEKLTDHIISRPKNFSIKKGRDMMARISYYARNNQYERLPQ